MPIKIQSDLPAKAELENENIFVMDEHRAMTQDFRELQILILNLMPIIRNYSFCGDFQTHRYRLILLFCRWQHTFQKTPQLPI